MTEYSEPDAQIKPVGRLPEQQLDTETKRTFAVLFPNLEFLPSTGGIV